METKQIKNDIIFVINNLLIHNEIIQYSDRLSFDKNEYCLFMGLSKPDITLPKDIKFFIDYDILEPFSGNFESGEVSYMLASKSKIEEKIKWLQTKNYLKNLNKNDFLPAIRDFKLSKLDI